MLSKHQVENLECNTTNNVLLSPIINHHFPPIFNYKVISQKITGEHNYEVELRASFRSNQFKAFFEHFQDATGIPLKAKPHGSRKVLGLKVAAKSEKVCRYADHETGKPCKSRKSKKTGQAYDTHITGCGATISLTERTPLNPNCSKKAHAERLRRDPDLMTFPTTIIVNWHHDGHNIGVLDELK